MINVLVVDDHQLVRIGTSRLLADSDGINVVGQAETGEQAIEMVRDLQPDVVLMDIQMPGMGGIEATRRCLRVNPDLKVIAITVHEEEPYPSRLLSVGAVGYLTKRANTSEMVLAIKKAVAGQRHISADLAQQMALKPFDEIKQSPFEALSAREMQITLMVINGHRAPDISRQLSLSPKTVNTYRYRIFEKLDISGDVELTKMAIKHKILPPEAVA